MTRAFLRSEREEAPARKALEAVADGWHDTPEAVAVRQRSVALARRLVAELVPAHPDPAFAARYLLLTLGAMGDAVAEVDPDAVDALADAVATGLLASLGAVTAAPPATPRPPA